MKAVADASKAGGNRAVAGLLPAVRLVKHRVFIQRRLICQKQLTSHDVGTSETKNDSIKILKESGSFYKNLIKNEKF